MRQSIFLVARLLPALAVLITAAGCATTRPRNFDSPDAAAAALADATRGGDVDGLTPVLGSRAADLVSSGDPVSDRADLAKFTAGYDEHHSIVRDDPDSATLLVGADKWPFPIPIVKGRDGWAFDADRGLEEIVARRIGRNELNTIQVCLAIVDAQREYAYLRIGGVPQYAQKFLSDPGEYNGLYWAVAEGDDPSPLGPLIATATEEGYARDSSSAEPTPYHGYRYRMLKAQGRNARGGETDYVINGRMIGGFAAVAWPAEYGSSGIMTFIVNHDGVVYEKDLGKMTARIAGAMSKYDPDDDWHPSAVPEDATD